MSPLDGLVRLTHGGRANRRTWRRGSVAHIEVRAVHRAEHRHLATEVEQALARHPGVAWARVVPLLGRVVLQLADDSVETSTLVELVEDVEAAHGVAGEPFPGDRPDHPGDREPFRRELAVLVADGVGLGAALAGRLAHLARLPVEVTAAVPLVQSQPWLWERIERFLGRGPADVGAAAVAALAAALSQGPLGLAVDAGERLLRLRESSAAGRVWAERHECLHAAPAPPAAALEAPPDRNGKAGPAATYAVRATVASVAAAGGTLLATGQPRRASTMLVAGMPKAAELGVEAFAADLHRVLGTRGVVCFDRGALRHLDRVDSVVVDARALLDGDDLAPGARELVAAAHGADHMVVVAGGDAALVDRLGADLLVEGGERLVESVRMLHDDGCGTLVVSADDPTALHMADCGLGLLDAEGRPPWGAHLLATERGLEDAVFLVEAAGVAHEVSRQSAALSLSGSGMGALLGAMATPSAGPGQALAAVNVAALAAMANGVRAASSLAGHRLEHHAEGPAWHALPVDEVLRQLDTGPDGLDDAEAARRLAELPPGEDRQMTLGRAFAEEMANPLTPILAAGATVSAAVGSPTDAGLVGGVVALNALVSATQRVRVDRAVGDLEAATAEATARVRRDGDLRTVRATELVPGDVLVLESGDAVPADCRVVRADNLELDESSLTGESLPVAKSAAPSDAAAVADRSSMLYEATAVAAGEAEAVVVAVGIATEAGSAAVGESVISRGVEERLTELSRVTMPVALAGGLLVTGTSLLRRRPLRQAVSPGVSLAVAAVPEGLPLLATVAQLSAAGRLADRGALARNPQAIETLGRVDVLCVDKTGTLTGGRIELGVVSDGVRNHDPDGDLTPAVTRIVAASVRASPEARPDEDLPHLTDRAVLEGAAEADVAIDAEIESWTRWDELPFEPGRGFHAVVGRNGSRGLLCVKGAPEVVLPRCDTWAHPDGDRRLTAASRRRLEATVEQLARRGHRVLAVAEREASNRRDLEDDRVARLHLLGFLGLVDPVRPEATEGVARLQSAGLQVVMVTGDHPSTAEGIARELGILDGGRMMTGVEIDELDEPGLDDVVEEVTVFARVTPSHKVRIVEAYRRREHTVAMTGDGANDAPAIRLADVGVALGEHATPAARSAADLVVPDGRIETIVAAIVEGRALWGSVRDALAILLGGNLGEVAFTVAGAVAAGEPPLSPRQLLLVNMMTDVAPSMAVAVRPPRDARPEDLLREGPDASLGSALHRSLAVRAVTTAVGAGTAWTAGRLTGRRRRASTIGLTALVGTQLGQTLLAGGRDPLVALAAVGSAAVLVGIVQTPGISQFFGCTPLGPVGWGIAVGSSLAATAVGFAVAPLLDRLLPGARPPLPPAAEAAIEASAEPGTRPALRLAPPAA